MPASIAEISRALTSDQFNNGEKSLIEWQYRMCGDFRSALWKAISHADDGNLNRLAKGFPQEIAAYYDFINGNLGNRIRDFGLDI